MSAEEQVGALGWEGGVGKFPERMSGTVEGNALGRVSQLSVLLVSLLGARTAGELQVVFPDPFGCFREDRGRRPRHQQGADRQRLGLETTAQ